MRRAAAILAVLAAAGGAAADELTIRNIPYPNVTVVGVTSGQIEYAVRGSRYRKPFEDVNLIKLDGQLDFNQAEKALSEKKHAAAVAGYDRAERRLGRGNWRVQLIRYRRLQALDGAGLLDRAVRDWLVIVDGTSASRASLDLAPRRLGKAKSETNKAAIDLLEARRKTAKDPDLQAAVTMLLRKLYGVEGLASRLRALDGGRAADTNTGGNGPRKPTSVALPTGTLSRRLQRAADLIQVGKYDEAAESLRAGLRGYTEGELTTALLLQGQALLRSYETSAAKPRQKLLAAGLSLMRVVAFAEPSDPEVPQALFLAAQVCERLGNRVAAENARRALVQRYGKTDWARKVQPGAPGGR